MRDGRWLVRVNPEHEGEPEVANIASGDMSTIAVGDIHANLPALNDILRQLRGEVAVGDTIVFLGDYIDRGPDTKGCVDAISSFNKRSAQASFACVETMRNGSFGRCATTDGIVMATGYGCLRHDSQLFG